MLKLSSIFIIAFLIGCRGTPSSQPPIHIVPDMDRQPKLKAQSRSDFFSDGGAMRVPPAGTVARGRLRADDRVYLGKEPGIGKPVAHSPINATLESLKRGSERYNIYCAVCHGAAGDGRGIVAQRGLVPPPTFHSDLIRGYPDGQLFEVITNGVRNMPSYRAQIPVEDRWHIINYLRALQRSQNARLEDVPPEKRDDLR